jgi:hypothetical protein
VKENENRTRSTQTGAVAPTTEASLRSEVTDLVLLSRLRDLGMVRLSGGLTLEQCTVLEQIEAALEAYRSYFYPLVTAHEVVSVPQTVRRLARRAAHDQGAWGPDVVKEEP